MGNQYLLSIKDFARYEGITPRSVKRRIEKNLIPTVKVKSKNGYGKNGQENRIHYSNFSSDSAREAFLRDRRISGEEKAENPPRRFLNLKPKQKDVADRREKIVKEYLQASRDVPSKTKTAFKKSFARSKGTGHRTLDSWIALYKKGGYYALVPNWNNGGKERKIRGEIELFIQRDYMVEFGPTVKKVHEDLIRLSGVEESKLPTYRSVARHIHSKWTPAQQLLIRDPEAYNRRHSPFVRRDWNAVDVNEVWIGDGKQIDVACLFRGKPDFPWFSFWMDARSRKFVGHIMVPTHNSQAIGQSLLYAVRQNGPPKTAYVDRGKDYKSIRIAGEKIKRDPAIKSLREIEETQIPGILRELGVEIFFAAPYNPREKLIESNFGFFTERLRHLPGYRGHNIKTRPKKLIQELKSRKILSFEELSDVIDNIIKERNALPHSTTGKSPDSYYDNFIPEIPTEAFLDFLNMDSHQVKVRNSVISIDKLFYRNTELFRLNGEKVLVKRDPKDITRAVVIYGDEVFCTATLETADHYRGPITLEVRKTCKLIREKERKFAAQVMASQEIVGPLHMEIEMMEEAAKPKKREIRPPVKSKVTTLHPKERLAREVSKEVKRGIVPLEKSEERLRASGGGEFLNRWAATFPPISKETEFEVPRYLGGLTYDENFED